MRATALRLSLAGALAAGLWLAACDRLPLDNDPAKAARRRVLAILEGIHENEAGPGTSLQPTICRWYKDVNSFADLGTMELAAEAFDQWRQDGDIWTVRSYEVDEQVLGPRPGDPPDTYYVRARINGNWHWLRVPARETISWSG